MAVDIVIQETIDLVDITVNPNIIEVNVTRTSGGGGSQTLAQTLDNGNQTGGENIVINNADAIELENTSLLKKGTYDFGGNGGISRICSNQYEDMWQNGFRHVFDQSGFIRNSSNGFDLVPDSSFDVTLRFKVGSFWSLDNGTTYICTDATEGAAVWELYSVGATPTLQEVTDEGATTTNDITVSKASGTSFIQVSNNNNTLTFQVDSLNGSLIELNDANNNNYGLLSCAELLMTNSDAGENVQLNSQYLSISSASAKPLIELNGSDGTLTGSVAIKTDLIDGDYTQQLPDKSGTFAMLDDVTGVPYTGATQNVDLGEFELKAGQIELDITPTGTAGVAVTRWNDALGSSETTLKGGSVILKNGVDLVARVVNKVNPNTTLTKANYQVVRISGAQGQRLAVNLAQANNDLNSADTLGVVTETINANQEGFILTVGQLEGINTTGSLQGETWADGDVLYLSPTTAGRMTNIKPNGSTGHIVIIGYVEYAHANNGKIYVKIMNGWELDELHNVYISSVANNQILSYDSAASLWKNKNLNQIVSERRNANNSSNNSINYCGTAPNGSAESSTVWTIKRLTIAASGSITTATATNVAWTNRQSATYI